MKKGELVTMVARRMLSNSVYMTTVEFEAAIREASGLKKGETAKPGTKITIPGIFNGPVVEKSRSLPKDAEIRAIYLTGTMAGSARGMEIVKRWKEVGGNAVVFDIKDSDGKLQVRFEHELAPKQKSVSISNLPKYVRFLHGQGMHAIARIALFRDEHIAQNHSELAVQSKRSGGPWSENGKQVWTDPSNPKVQEYNLALAKYVATQGADEIQFDYVRFPAEGDQKDAKFVFDAQQPVDPKAPRIQRADVIANFLKTAYGQLKSSGVLVSIDVFGIMAWQRPVDLSHTGQDIARMAKHCDVMSPMIYPSHFFGMDGVASPGDAPEHFIESSMTRFTKITSGSGVVLRPWLQAFAWKTKTYSPEYIKVQVASSKKTGGIGFLFWNARNDYAKPYEAMPVMMQKPELYLVEKKVLKAENSGQGGGLAATAAR